MAELLSDIRIDPGTGKVFILSETTDIDSGTNTSIFGGKLIDAGATFKTTKVRRFDRVFNTTNNTETFVTSIDNETDIILKDDIFAATPEDYEIKRIIADAELISGGDVIAQDAVIRLRTHIGTVKRQEIDLFGWDLLGILKSDVTLDWVSTIANEITRVVKEDNRVSDATVEVDEAPSKGVFIFNVKLRTEEGEFLSFPLAIPTG